MVGEEENMGELSVDKVWLLDALFHLGGGLLRLGAWHFLSSGLETLRG